MNKADKTPERDPLAKGPDIRLNPGAANMPSEGLNVPRSKDRLRYKNKLLAIDGEGRPFDIVPLPYPLSEEGFVQALHDTKALGASAVIVVTDFVSTDWQPSLLDLALNGRLVAMGVKEGLPVLDRKIAFETESYSFKDAGCENFNQPKKEE